MIPTAFGLALASLVVVMGALIQYFSTIPRGKVPVKPVALTTFLSAGIGLAVIAIFKSFSGSVLSIVAVIIPSALALLMASGIFWLLSQRKTPIGDLKVKPGSTTFFCVPPTIVYEPCFRSVLWRTLRRTFIISTC